MSIEGSRIGRQSNLFKHKMVEMQRRGLIRSHLRNVIATNSRKRININPENDGQGKYKFYPRGEKRDSGI